MSLPVGLRFVDAQEMLPEFSFIPQVRVTALDNRITVFVPAINDSAHLVADDVRRVRRIYGPDGSAALEFVIDGGTRVWPFLVTGADVVFQPQDPADLLDTTMRYSVTDMPPLVAYTEMLREIQQYATDGGARRLVDNAAGSMLQTRCFIAGAVRFGLRPLVAAYCWERAWRRVEYAAVLPPWRPDPAWDALVADAEAAAGAGLLDLPGAPAPVDEQSGVRDLRRADFETLAPRLAVVRLDEEFVDSWRRWVPVTPATFEATLLRGVADARAEVTLYPDGGGSVDVSIPVGDRRPAFLQLRFSMPEAEMAIDEIRIPKGAPGGLFQRLVFNTESLAARLGLSRVAVYATGVGAYAFAGVGVYPRDPELYRATRDG